jgi:predicted AAA+ superfamily ATPase
VYDRHLADAVRTALADTPVTLLQGARQVGKSTLAQQFVSAGTLARYITLDDLTVLGAVQADPTGFLAGLGDDPVAIDEVQRVPELLLALKAAVDRDRRPGQFLLTGSANVLQLPRLADSLAGRMAVLTLRPLSQGELEGGRERFVDALFGTGAPRATGAVERAEIVARVLRGGYPEAIARADPARRAAWFDAYLATVLGRDVRDLSHVEDLAALPRLLRVFAARASGLLNLADAARDLAMPASTVKRYATLLERVFLVDTLPAWSASVGPRLVKAPKVLVADTGLAAYLLNLTVGRLAENPAAFGSVLENFVGIELLKQAAWSHSRVELFHLRAHMGREVDLVLEDADGRIVGVEVKAAATVRSEDAAGLRWLAGERPRQFHRGIVLYLGDAVIPLGERLHAVPVSALWQHSVGGVREAAPRRYRRARPRR